MVTNLRALSKEGEKAIGVVYYAQGSYWYVVRVTPCNDGHSLFVVRFTAHSYRGPEVGWDWFWTHYLYEVPQDQVSLLAKAPNVIQWAAQHYPHPNHTRNLELIYAEEQPMT